VETYEFRYPLLYLYRRQESDTGGPGKFRGGAGIGLAMTPHDVEEIRPVWFMDAALSSRPPRNRRRLSRQHHAIQHPPQYVGARAVEQGQIPVEFDALDGRLEPKSSEDTFLRRGDVFERVACGGGGFGDPLERDPELVKRTSAASIVQCGLRRAVLWSGVQRWVGKRGLTREPKAKKGRIIRAERARWEAIRLEWNF
jgi:N-methylhydantoinase B